MANETKGLLSTSASVALGQTTGSGRVTGGGTTQRGRIGLTPPAQPIASTANCSARDILSTLPVQQVWLWYGRLSRSIARRPVAGGGTPLASLFMDRYLNPNPHASSSSPQVLYVFTAPAYLKDHSIVLDAIAYHRRVYLTQERARLGSSRRWAGVKPRWQNPSRYGWTHGTPLSMYYEALVEVPLRWQITGNAEEKDILYALGMGFQLRTDVTVNVTHSSNHLNVTFTRFTAKVVDTYDFNYSEHITVPNPDYNSTSSNAICPRRDRIVVYHTNARRMEQANLAAPYPLESNAWDLMSVSSLSAPGRVTL